MSFYVRHALLRNTRSLRRTACSCHALPWHGCRSRKSGNINCAKDQVLICPAGPPPKLYQALGGVYHGDLSVSGHGARLRGRAAGKASAPITLLACLMLSMGVNAGAPGVKETFGKPASTRAQACSSESQCAWGLEGRPLHLEQPVINWRWRDASPTPVADRELHTELDTAQLMPLLTEPAC